MAGRRGRWIANAIGIAIIVVVLVVAYVLSEEVLHRSPPAVVQQFSAKCSAGGGNGTGNPYYCDLNLTLSSGTVTLNWTVTGGNATLVYVTVNVTANNTTQTVAQADATHTGSLDLTICNSSLPHKTPCQAPPGNFSFMFQAAPGVNGWVHYRLSGYFQAKSQS